jgi:hypothetical protein
VIDSKAPLPLMAVALLAVMGWSRGSAPSGPPAVESAAREAVSSAGAHHRAPASKEKTAPETAAAEAAALEGWREPFRLYGEFFGLERTPSRDKENLAQSAGELSGPIRDGYELDFLVALVPDPIDSQMPAAFDQALDGIQKGLANVHVDGAQGLLNRFAHGPDSWDEAHLSSFPWLLDRNWLPWTESTGEERLYRRAPGLMLFRKLDPSSVPPLRRLTGVFLVGETPKRGIQQEAFAQALRLIVALRGTDQTRPLRIVGPSYSGSAESLRLALLHSRSAGAKMPIEIVTGSATAPGLEDVFADPGLGDVEFYRAVLPDSVLQAEALRELHDAMGWNLCKLALITESDTTYGQGLERERIVHALAGNAPAAAAPGACSPAAQDGLGDALVLHFPSHLSAIRSASEAATAKRPAAPADQVGVQSPKTDLDLSLAEEGTPADRVPELSPLTAADNEQAIANLLEAISREGIGYVGILASDVRDRLFLADRIRRFAPDVTLFTLDADLLFAHRQVQASMNDMVVLSTFQLFTEGGVGLHGTDLDANHRRQFTSEFEEGIFHAVRALNDPTPLRQQVAATRDPVLGWISVTSNGSLWPVLSVEIKRAQLPRRQNPPFTSSILALDDPDSADLTGPGGKRKRDQPLSSRTDLGLLLSILALCGLAYGLRRAALEPAITVEAGGQVESTRALLCFGLTVLALAGGLVLVLEAMEYFAFPAGWAARYGLKLDPYPVAMKGPEQWLCLLALLPSYLFLVWNLAVAWGPARLDARGERGRGLFRLLGWLAAAAAVVALTWFALLVWAIPGEIEYFELRSRVFSSGLSPVISLGWLVAGLSVWALLELKRRSLIAWQQVDWPLADSWDPALRGSGAAADRLGRLICRTAPTGRRFGIAVLVPVAAALVLMWRNVQPLGETQAYARFFLLVLLFAMVLGGIACLRFYQAWQLLRTLLLRVEQTPLLARFPALQPEVGWKPLQSFGWRWPGFNLLVLSTRRLLGLVRPDRPPLLEGATETYVEQLSRLLAQSLDSGGSAQEKLSSRRRLEQLLCAASREVKTGGGGQSGGGGEAGVESFLALRLIAYVRYIFSHLRSFVIGGLFPLLLLLFAVTSYAFEPKRLLSFGLLGGLLVSVIVTLAVFAAMDRNAVLSRIAGNEVGEIKFDRAFFGNLLTYGIVPLLGLLATQVPEASQLLNDWLKPLLRIIGVG